MIKKYKIFSLLAATFMLPTVGKNVCGVPKGELGKRMTEFGAFLSTIVPKFCDNTKNSVAHASFCKDFKNSFPLPEQEEGQMPQAIPVTPDNFESLCKKWGDVPNKPEDFKKTYFCKPLPEAGEESEDRLQEAGGESEYVYLENNIKLLRKDYEEMVREFHADTNW